jgi:hypothetical protein
MILLSACIDFIILHALTSLLLLCSIHYSVPPPSPLFPALWARETQEAQDTNWGPSQKQFKLRNCKKQYIMCLEENNIYWSLRMEKKKREKKLSFMANLTYMISTYNYFLCSFFSFFLGMNKSFHKTSSIFKGPLHTFQHFLIQRMNILPVQY